MRILFIVVQFPPDVNSTGFLMAELCDGLAREGHEVSVITTFPHYEGFRIAKEYRRKLFRKEQYRGMDVVRLYVYAPGKKSMLNRLMSYLSFAGLAALAGLCWRKRWDLILCTNGGFFTGVTSWLIGAGKRIPFIYNVQDLYPEVPVQAGQLRNPYAIEWLKRIERFMYRKARRITVISPSMRENLLKKDVPERKLSVIPNFVDTQFIRPLPRANAFSTEHGLDHKFVVSHAGNLGYVYDLDTLIEAAALLVAETEILFLIVGDGVARPELERKARGLGLCNVRFLPFQPRASLPFLRASSDVQVSLYRKGAVRYSMPSKVYEIMASGRPLLASADRGSELWALVEGTGCGLCVEPEDPRALAGVILSLRRDPGLREKMGRSGRQCAERRYCKEVAVRSYHRLIQQVAGGADTERPVEVASPTELRTGR
jgi:colanic acid biosynthesis glycosyl transferase WcaI